MTIPCKRVVSIFVLVLLGLAVGRAATRRYQEREDAFRKECQEARERSGLSADDLQKKYPSPTIRLLSAASVPPGATADVVATGTFAAGARFFVENDSFEVLKEGVTGNQYRATVKAAPGIGPEDASLAVINPVTAQMARIERAVRVAGRFEWTMQASNGWKVVAGPRTVAPGAAANEYDLSFFRPGETAAFRKVQGRLAFLRANQRNFNFDLEDSTPAPAGVEAMQALALKMADPKLTPAEQEKLLAQLEKAQQELTAMVTKMTDPAYIKKQEQERERLRQEFGCTSLEITAEGGKVSGEMSCAEKVGRRLTLTGTFGPVK